MSSTTLKKQYDEKIVPALTKEFNYTTPMQVPRLTKIVINEGLGEATQDKKIIETAINELTAITGQKAVAIRYQLPMPLQYRSPPPSGQNRCHPRCQKSPPAMQRRVLKRLPSGSRILWPESLSGQFLPAALLLAICPQRKSCVLQGIPKLTWPSDGPPGIPTACICRAATAFCVLVRSEMPSSGSLL